MMKIYGLKITEVKNEKRYNKRLKLQKETI